MEFSYLSSALRPQLPSVTSASATSAFVGELNRQAVASSAAASVIAPRFFIVVCIYLSLTEFRSEIYWCNLSLANCYEGRYYRQIAPRKGDASPFLNGLGDSETIGAAKHTATKSAHTA